LTSSGSEVPASSAADRRPGRVREALRIVLLRRHLRRTLTIALVVGIVLTTINHADTIVSGDASTATAVKSALNFVVPFVVSNLGLLSRQPGSERGSSPPAPERTGQPYPERTSQPSAER
jgi:hypothetical protein